MKKHILLSIFLVSLSSLTFAQLTPWNAKLWVTHPLDTTITDTIYVGLTEDGIPQFQLGADVLDTSSITANPINLRLHSDTIKQELNTPCLGNLSTQILAFDTTKNVFDVTFSFWVVSDTVGSAFLNSFNSACSWWSYSSGLHWDTTDFKFSNQKYELVWFDFSSVGGYLCGIDGYSAGGGAFPLQGIGYFEDQPVSVHSESFYPACSVNMQATRIEMRVQFASHDTIPILLGENQAHQKEVVTKIYPNPTLNEFTIDFGKTFSGGVNIFSPTGKKIFTQQINNRSKTQLNLKTTLPKGIYLVTITDNKGNTKTHKVILTENKN